MGFRPPPFNRRLMTMDLQASPPDAPAHKETFAKTVVGLDDLTWDASGYNDEPITTFHVEIDQASDDIGTPVFTGAGLDDLTADGTITIETNHTFTVVIDGEGTAAAVGAAVFTGTGTDDLTAGGTFVGVADADYLVVIDSEGTASDVEAAVFTGSGLDDLTSGGTFTDTLDAEFVVTIDAEGIPDTFAWTKNGSGGAAGVAITGAAQALSDGVTVAFLATTGHTATEFWTIQAIAEVPDTFKWNVDAGAFTEDVPITGAAQALSDGVTVEFATTIGHTLDDQWEIAATIEIPDTFKWQKDAGAFTELVDITGDAQALSDGLEVTFAATIGHTDTEQWEIEINLADEFAWTQDGAGGATGVAITGAAQTLAEAVEITFAGVHGHTLADEWDITITPRVKVWFDDQGVLTYINSNGTTTP